MPDPVIPAPAPQATQITTPAPAPVPVPTASTEPVSNVVATKDATSVVQTVVTPEVTPVAPVVELTPAPVLEPVTAEKPAPTSLVGETLTKELAPAPAVEPTKPESGGQSEETAPPPSETVAETPLPEPVYEPFQAPEGISLDAGRVKEFTDILADLEKSGKADHTVVQQFGQKAVEFHVNEMNRVMKDYQTSLENYWEKQKSDWREATIKDPELGGNRLQTNVDAAVTFIRTHGGTPEQQQEFRDLMNTSGLGNHPAVIRLFANAARSYAEGKPLANVKPVSAPKSKTGTLYGKMPNG